MNSTTDKPVPVVKICPTVEELQWKFISPGTRLICPVKDCHAFAFKSQRYLTLHINTFHPDLSMQNARRKWPEQAVQFHCPQKGCNYSSIFDRFFTSFEQLKYHYLNTHEEKRFPCRKCEKRFGLQRDCKYHERECGQTFSCGVCSSKYPSRRALLTHCTRKRHPVPPEYEKPQQNNSSHTAAPQPVPVSSKLFAGPRQILPKGLMIVTSVLPTITVINQDIRTNTEHLIPTSCSMLQFEISEAQPFHPQRLSKSGISTGCQAGNSSLLSLCRQVLVADNATQVSAMQHRPTSCSSQLCHMATQISGSVTDNIVSTQIDHTDSQASNSTMNSSPQKSAKLLPVSRNCMENAATQVSVVVVHSETQMGFVRQVSAVAVQTNRGSDVTNMAIQATNPVVDFSHIATQASDDVPALVDISTQVSEPRTSSAFCPVLVNSDLVQSRTFLSGATIATQASVPCISPKKESHTSSIGTQMATIFSEDAGMATTGMQTSLTLIRKFGVIAETQTSGDLILQSAMASADSHVKKLPGRNSGGRRRVPGCKKSVKSSEVQTYNCFPQRKKRHANKAHAAAEGNQRILQDFSSVTQTVSSQSENLSDVTLSSVKVLQNPTLSSSAVSEEDDEILVSFFSSSSPPHISTSDTGLQADLDSFLSSYTAEFGVQTKDDFFSACTADFGVQTPDFCLETCTADLGIQTASHECLLNDLDCGTSHQGTTGDELAVKNITYQMAQGFFNDIIYGQLAVADCGTETKVLTLDSQTQTNKNTSLMPIDFNLGIHFAECGTEIDSCLPGYHSPVNPKLFDSFDSDLSFSDCGTCTEDFLASTHTQTSSTTVRDHPVNPILSTLVGRLGGPDDSLLDTQTPDSLGEDLNVDNTDSRASPFLPGNISALFSSQTHNHNQNNSNSLAVEESDPILSTFNLYEMQPDCVPQAAMSKSSSSAETDLSAVAAADMHTQTADDLLDFLMNNMETQTTEIIPDKHFASADIQTQTTGNLLLSSYPVSPSHGGGMSSFDDECLSLVSTETQTYSSQFLMELDEDTEDLFDIADMQTQTSIDLL